MYLIDLHDVPHHKIEPSAINGSGAKPRLAAALGSFDGVHAGHAALISRTVELARERGISSAVFTFTDEPSALPGKVGMHSITTFPEKLTLIASLGADYALLEDFSRIRDYSPERFVNELLRGEGGVEYAICGFNFRFGKGGSGDSEALCRLMPESSCEILPPIEIDGRPVSSSAIRLALENGDIETANRMLNHEFFIDFPVVHGKELGRTIGVPTINQNFPEGHVIPGYGVYATRAYIDGTSYPAVSNIGVRPSIDNDSHYVNCETHIIDFDGWLYGKEVRVSFYRRLRGEMKFSDIDGLTAQINRDISTVRAFFGERE